ncbi:hypothetical protein BKA70DRAFT_1147013 [Coprinopsis sp. MPI-PUGE-AT-0042]|nr:hypothetical protein BKA70DRAFT_1147013 [Coprinopsis sp. MPI-PUGE-AT-0042]
MGESDGQSMWQLQKEGCKSFPAEQLSHCRSCTDTPTEACRFAEIRWILLKGAGSIHGIAFSPPQGQREMPPTLEYTKQLIPTLGFEGLREMKAFVAGALLPSLLRERDVFDHHDDVAYIAKDAGNRVECGELNGPLQSIEMILTRSDSCLTSIFSSSRICKLCGAEVCPDCFAEFEEGTPSAVFPTCHSDKIHEPRTFFVGTWMLKEVLDAVIAAMQELLSRPDAPQRGTSHGSNSEIHNTPPVERGVPNISTFTANNPPTPHTFHNLWIARNSFVVTGLECGTIWSPAALRNHLPSVSCSLCTNQWDAEKPKEVSIEKFLSSFGTARKDYSGLLLKDWPHNENLKRLFPEGFGQLDKILPLAEYVSRQGVYNLASHFPDGVDPPDIGPKLHCSRSAKGKQKCKVPLHMAPADTMDLMVWKAEKPATWDVFHPSDSDKLREFLYSKGKHLDGEDPIHSLAYYLNDHEICQLSEKFGVRPFRIHQAAGDAIFLPAGSAFQISNESDCINLCYDFVSPESIVPCAQLVREYREQSRLKEKADVLQLDEMMWFAWHSLCARENLPQTPFGAAIDPSPPPPDIPLAPEVRMDSIPPPDAGAVRATSKRRNLSVSSGSTPPSKRQTPASIGSAGSTRQVSQDQIDAKQARRERVSVARPGFKRKGPRVVKLKVKKPSLIARFRKMGERKEAGQSSSIPPPSSPATPQAANTSTLPPRLHKNRPGYQGAKWYGDHDS